MIRYGLSELPDDVSQALGGYQAEVNATAGYAARVREAERLFSSRNRAENPIFMQVRATLHVMCGGLRRCMYCEDNCAHEIEHFRPKSFYPDMVFVWANYLYACGICNGAKSNRFSIISTGGDQVIDLVRRSGDPVVSPASGDPMLIDPRHEEPLEFLRLDLRDTFYLVPTGQRETLSYKRARHTIDVLKLNSREPLVLARRLAYEDYRDRLNRYVQEKRGGAPDHALDLTIQRIRASGHRTVWEEMKRQRDHHAEVRSLFLDAPEALGW